MANQKNIKQSVQLNGQLNFSKLKTGITSYTGWNDINSPIYGDCISPVQKKLRDKNEMGNNRPFLKDNKVIDNDGKTLLDISNYKGITRKALAIPKNALAVYDSTHWVINNPITQLTEIHNGTNTTFIPFLANVVSYTATGDVIMVHNNEITAYKSETYEKVAEASCLDVPGIKINVFHDSDVDWDIVSVFPSFGDWGYKHYKKNDRETDDYIKWRLELEKMVPGIEAAKAAQQKALDDLTPIEEAYATAYGAYEDASGRFFYMQGLRNRGKLMTSEWEQEKIKWDNAQTDWKNWKEADALDPDYPGLSNMEVRDKRQETYNNSTTALSMVETPYNDLKKTPPTRFKKVDSPSDYFRGNVIFEPMTFIYDSHEGSAGFYKQNLKDTSEGCHPVNYIVTGIEGTEASTGEVTDHNQWNLSAPWTGTCLKMYNISPVPYEIMCKGPSSEEGPSYLYIETKAGYKLKEAEEDARAILAKEKENFLAIGADNMSKLSVTNTAHYYNLGALQSSTGEIQSYNIYGTGKTSSYYSWAVMDIKSEDFNRENSNRISIMHASTDSSYGVNTSIDGATDKGNIVEYKTSDGEVQYYFNTEVCSEKRYVNIPIVGGNVTKKALPTFLFREIYNNGVLSNIAVTEDPTKVGTLLETPGQVDPDIPIFYKGGRDGKSVIYKIRNGSWIEASITDTVTKLKMLNERFCVLETANQINCIDLEEKEQKHFASDWNNRLGFFNNGITSINNFWTDEEKLPIALSNVAAEQPDATKEPAYDPTTFAIGTGININFELTADPIVGYTAKALLLKSVRKEILLLSAISKVENLEIYSIDFNTEKSNIPYYQNTQVLKNYYSSSYNNTDLANVLYPNNITNIPGLFCKFRNSNFGRVYIEDEGVFYNLLMYNGVVFYAFYISSLLDDVKELFMVQGQTFAITRSDYIYSVYIDRNGVASLADAIMNVKGLQFCGAIPEMAIFYSPINRTLKSFTADHILKDLQQATEISRVYYTTYDPQTSSIYIATNNGLYDYSFNNQFRLPILNIDEIYFSKKHTYISYKDENGNDKVLDNVIDTSEDLFEYELEPVKLESRYYGAGQNGVSITDCVYFRLYSAIGPVDTYINFKERALTDNTYKTATKELKVTKKDWDVDTNTCYIRYQPVNQRSVGFSLSIETPMAISEIVESVSPVDTTSISKPTMNA